MPHVSLPLALAGVLAVSSLHAGELTPAPGPAPASVPGEFDLTKIFNAASFRYVGSFDMDFENSHGALDTHAFQLSAFLSQPIRFAGDWQFIPQFSYESMMLDPSGFLPGLLIDDQDLHEIELSFFFAHMSSASPWVYVGWLSPALATDFQGISGDDFFLDAALAAGYRFNDRLMAGLGVGALDLTGDISVYAGPGFFWTPNDQVTVALYGPNFQATMDMSDSWRIGAEVRPNGGIWNIDTVLGSANIDYSSFRAGLTSSHRLAGDLWLSYGGGLTFGGEINVTNTKGSKVFQNQLDDLESGAYGFVGLDLKTW